MQAILFCGTFVPECYELSNERNFDPDMSHIDRGYHAYATGHGYISPVAIFPFASGWPRGTFDAPK
jgi:hypothetical protein